MKYFSVVTSDTGEHYVESENGRETLAKFGINLPKSETARAGKIYTREDGTGNTVRYTPLTEEQWKASLPRPKTENATRSIPASGRRSRALFGVVTRA